MQKSVELPNTEIMRVYPHMTQELITISLDNSQKNISLRKVIDYETYPLLRQRAGLHPLDRQQKLGYFL
ncbi:MAG: hypothetical protein LBG59_02335 [Candidatus Peribacteria bacterium]|nr:hypothetical protein [Candidatus Peribacteria bacterium]